MKTEVEFRIDETLAARHLPPGTGKPLGEDLRKVVVLEGCPLHERIIAMEREFRSRGDFFFTYWNITYRYSRAELGDAELFSLWSKRFFEPAGEECGTKYEESTTRLGPGRQMTPLHLPSRKIPRGTDFAETIASELVVSRRVAEAIANGHLRGAQLDPVLLSDAKGRASEEYFQMRTKGPLALLDKKTRFADTPADPPGYPSDGRCLRENVLGLNKISEVWVRRKSYSGADFVSSREFFGVRRGLLRPRPVLLISQRARLAFEEAKLKGYFLEVAHLK